MKERARKKISIILSTAIAVCTIFGATSAKAEEQETDIDAAWDYGSEIKETEGAFTFHAIPSKDGTEAWIHEVVVNKKKPHSVLKFPEMLGQRKVTRLGYSRENDPDWDDFRKNIFGSYVELAHEIDGTCVEGIKEIIMPDTIEVIQPGTFSGADDITSVTISNKVTVLDRETFYGCDRLKTVHLPESLEELNPLAFIDCPKLKSLDFPSGNRNFKVKNHCVVEKKSQRMVCALPCKGTLKIPEGTKTIQTYAMCNCTSPTVYIPSSVKEIEDEAFYKFGEHANKKIKNVTVSKKNKTYAKDGQCIYRKKDKSLAVAIPDNRGVLVISEKVERLKNDCYSFVNCDTWNEGIKKVIFPKKLKYAEVPALARIGDANKVYFMGKKPPKIIDSGQIAEGWAALPVMSDIYVPKESAKLYKKWYKKYDGDGMERFHTFVSNNL